MVERLRKNPALKKTCDDWVRQHVDNRPLMHRLFTNAEYADTISNYNQTAEDLFHLATIAQNSAVGERINLYKLFTTDELYHLWQQTNIWWYLYYGASALSNGQMTWAEKPLVKDIVAKADSCLLLRHPGATMRFGHESVVLPLVCLLDINGYGVQTSNVDSLESYGWIGSEIFPMASNVQFIFYKPTTAGANNILVKVLLNEEEATLPLKPAEGLTLPDAPKNAPNPYYKWTDVRNYLVGIIKRQ